MALITHCPPNVITDCACEGRGPGVTVEITQFAGDIGGWRIKLYAMFGARRVVMQELAVAALVVGTRPSRVLYVGGAPAATKWMATVYPAALGTNDRYLDVGIRASKDLVTSTVVST